jgi:hypothetical protein
MRERGINGCVGHADGLVLGRELAQHGLALAEMLVGSPCVTFAQEVESLQKDRQSAQ